MVIAVPKSPKKAKKSPALPEGIEQLAFFSSLTPVATVIAKASKRSRKKPAGLPEGATQLDIFSLLSTEFEKSDLDPTIKSRQADVQPEQPRQLTLDDILAAPLSEVAIQLIRSPGLEAEDEQPQQLALDDIIDASPRGVTIPLTQPLIKPEAEYDQPRQTEQFDSDTLAKPPANDVGSISEGEQAGGGTGSDSGEVRGSVVRTDNRAENELFGSLGDGNRSDSPTRHRARRRVILDEPEPSPKSSRDLRITEEHGVGSGNLHEKAHANISAIRLLKAIEAEGRAATEDEKAVLVKYAGWGALAQVFEPEWRMRQEWRTVAAELKELLTEEEYNAAKATTPNAHFTSPMVVNAIWQGLEKLGVTTGAEILEPSMGVGHFFGLMPPSLEGGHRTGVELDSVTARIAKHLYPDATIFAKGFEETPLPDNYFDVAIGNVPFGNYGVHDPSMQPKLRSSIHDYFFAKSLEKIRPGGMMALVTSRYTMDKKDTRVRKHLAEQADLVAAVRLPNTAFKGNAGTEVVTDILFLRKRPEGAEPGGEKWTEAETTRIDGQEVPLNEYFVRHPEMMIGEIKLIRGMYRDQEPTLVGELTPEKLQGVLNKLPEGIYTPRDQGRSPPPPLQLAAPERFVGIKDGGYAVVDGQIVIRNGTSFSPTALSSANAARVKGMVEIRSAVREVFRTQLDDASSEETITAARQTLNRVYDQFVRRNGPLSSKENLRAFTGDPDQPLLLSLEQYNEETKTATKTAIFERRTLERPQPVEHVETAAEALAISLNETSGIDWNRMADLTGTSVKEVQADLSGQVFLNPESGGIWQTADEYLSGDVRAKLRDAEAAAEINPTYRRNIEALKAVQPADIPPGEIHARLGASWIPRSDIRDFVCEILQVRPEAVTIGHANEIATWSCNLDFFAERTVANTTTYGTKRMTASELIEAALNMRTPTICDTLPNETRIVNQTETIAAREMQQKLKDRFATWIWENPERTERLARAYNEAFNNIRLRTYDGSHLSVPGMNRAGLRNNDLDKHQKDAVWRILQNKNTLIGHVVGAGKTASITASAMELKRLGLASKSMIVVPNHLVEQWGSEFLKLYPQANIFVAGKDFFTAGNREKAMARIATGNYDAVIISHKSFESLPVSDTTFKRFVGKQISSLEEAILEASSERNDNRSLVKDLAKAKLDLERKIKDHARREKKDDGVTWEQLGIDRIFVDEADLFKNLGYTTKMNRIAGLPNTQSDRALDMYMKTQYLNERGGGTVFATGTPISNTMAEMYTLMRYLAPEALTSAGVEHFDAWAANFGEAVTALELAPDGSGYRMHTRFAKFVNMPELLSMFRTFADIQTADMLNLPRPVLEGGKPKIVAAPPSPELKAFVEGLVQRAEKIRSGKVNPRTDNMLKITSDGRKAALDLRLVDPNAEPNPNSKLKRAIENIHQIWRETEAERSTQLVFCDLSTPNPNMFNVYDEIRKELLERGVAAKEIAFIHEADTDTKKKKLFDAVNAGRIRVLLGSTEKMGAGTNVQKKLIAMHHLDAPWRPRDIEQRDGRILRQGNENKEVSIFRYVTEGSFDAYMWQTLETKQRFIEQVMNGKTSVREAEDLESGALSFAEIKAIASGNPAVLEKVKTDMEIRKLDALRAAHVSQQYEISREVRSLPGRIEEAKVHHAGLLADIARRDASDEAFTMIVEGYTFSGKGAREQAGKALVAAIMADKEDTTLKVRGQIAGFEILSQGNPYGSEYQPQLYLRATHTYHANINPDNAAGTVASIEYVLRRLDRDAEEEQAKYERMEKALLDYMGQLHIPFEHEERLRELLIKQRRVNSQLDLDKGDSQATAIAPEVDGQERDERIAPQQEPREGDQQAGTEVQQATEAAPTQVSDRYTDRQLSSNTDRQINEEIAIMPSAEPQADQAHASDHQVQQQSSDSNPKETELSPETVNLFSTRKAGKGLLACQVGEQGSPSRIVITENMADAMSYYQLCGNKPGLYISFDGEFSDIQKIMLRQILTRNPQAKIVTATDADRDGEKYAVFISSIRPEADRARPSLRERRGIKYESWNDVRMGRPMQPQAPSPQPSGRSHEADTAHELSPSVTPVNWGNRGKSAIPPNVD